MQHDTQVRVMKMVNDGGRRIPTGAWENSECNMTQKFDEMAGDDRGSMDEEREKKGKDYTFQVLYQAAQVECMDLYIRV